MTTEVQRAIESGFESPGHYLESLRDFDRVLDCLDRNENISEETKEKYHQYLDEIGIDGVFELAKNTNELFKELGINSYRLQQVEHCRKIGLIGGRKGGLIGGRATVETHGDQMRNGYANSLGNITPKKHSENSRKGARASALARGFHIWSLEEIAEIGELKYGEGLTWNDTTSKMNEKYGGDWSTSKVRDAYRYNKDKLPDEEE